MTEGHQMNAWDHTAAMLAKIHNVNCAKTSDMKNPSDFHPHRQPKKIHMGNDISALKALVPGGVK